MGNYLLRNVPEKEWRALKALALAQGKTIRAVIIELIMRAVRVVR